MKSAADLLVTMKRKNGGNSMKRLFFILAWVPLLIPPKWVIATPI